MNHLKIDTDIIRKFAHSGLKTLGSIQDLLEIFEMDEKGGLHDPEVRKVFLRSINALCQLIRDLRLLAVCDDMASVSQNAINWRSIIESCLAPQFAEMVSLSIEEADYIGSAHTELIKNAVGNMAWFAGRFGKCPIKARLNVVEKEGGAWIRLTWDFGDSIIVEPGFAACTPFHPLFPKESLSLDKSTGLVFVAVKRILEIHGGIMTAHCAPQNFKLEWLCPRSPLKKTI